jgi:hypothetical protein
MSNDRAVSYGDVIGNDASLKLFLESLAKFDRLFCDHMADGDDFTLKVEVHGCSGKIVHVRTSSDGFKRPPGMEPEEKKRKTWR